MKEYANSLPYRIASRAPAGQTPHVQSQASKASALAKSNSLRFVSSNHFGALQRFVSSFSLFPPPPLLLALLSSDTLDCARREDSERTLDSEGDLENTFSETELGEHRMSATADLLPGEMGQHRARVSGSYAEAPRHRFVQAALVHAAFSS